MKYIVSVVLAAIAAASCGGGNPSPSPGNSQGPSSTSRRLAWTQAALALADVQRYDFILFIDGTRTALPSATCAGTAPMFECSAPLPQLPIGPHVLELSAVDRVTGLESARSAQVLTGQSAERAGSVTIIEPIPPAGSARKEGNASEPDIPALACSARTCFDVSLVADDLGAVERLVSLPDGRLLAFYADAIVRSLPDGIAQRLQLDRSGTARFADIAVDPDFLSNRFVYLAASARADGGRSAVSIVRMREVAGRLGEPATIATELPAAGEDTPAIAIGPDARIYLALPSGNQRPAGGPYDGLVLRLTREGAAAGDERTNSPIIASGSARPSSFGWLGDGRLLLASRREPHGAPLGFVPLMSRDTWPAAVTPLPVPDTARLEGGITEIAADTSLGTGPGRLFLLGADPAALYMMRWEDADPAGVSSSIDEIALRGMTPVTFALAGDGSLRVAAHKGNDSTLLLLRLQPVTRKSPSGVTDRPKVSAWQSEIPDPRDKQAKATFSSPRKVRAGRPQLIDHRHFTEQPALIVHRPLNRQ